MEDYPQNLTEFESRFSSEEACREYLFRLRWPDGFRCPGCGCGKSWPLRKVLLQCAACGRQTSVTAGTIFQDTRSPLPLWFRAMWWVTTQKPEPALWDCKECWGSTGTKRLGPGCTKCGARWCGRDGICFNPCFEVVLPELYTDSLCECGCVRSGLAVVVRW